VSAILILDFMPTTYYERTLSRSITTMKR